MDDENKKPNPANKDLTDSGIDIIDEEEPPMTDGVELIPGSSEGGSQGSGENEEQGF